MKRTILNRFSSILFPCLALTGLLLSALTTTAQPRAEYRGFWVDTFNTSLNTPTQVLAVINNAKLAKANAIFVQVRRRGDSWYLNSLEPPADRQPITPGFDPLLELINQAHKPENNLEVHAFVIVGAVWNRDPRCPTLQPPAGHVFLSNGGFNNATANIVPGPNNWLTRTLLPDSVSPHPTTCQIGTPPAIGFNGHRFGAEFWIDLGHPAAAAYTNNVLMHLVQNYNLDGLHLDRIRYPEFTASGQTPSNGTNIGYNDTSIARFNLRYGRSGTPAQNDPQWSQWRRDQVTNFVRRLYLNVVAVKRQMKLSGSYIAFGGGPTTEPGWNSAEAYWRVYQDWRAWTEEGITDIAMPMDYKRENSAVLVNQPLQFDQWSEWLKNHQYRRAGLVGQGAFLNSIEGTLRQTRRALAPSIVTGNSGIGVTFFSMATSNIAVPLNPHSIPPGQNTPVRSFAEFASGLTTGKSVNSVTLYELPGQTPIFNEPATIPMLPWKSAPTLGHLMGFAKRADTTPLDTASVTIQNLSTNATRNSATDGNGFFGGVDLAPGQYLVKVELGAETLYSCVATVTAGNVTRADAGVDNTAPVTTATLNPPAPNGSNDWYTSDVTTSLDAADSCAGVASTLYSIDGGATWQPYTGSFVISQEGITNILYRSTDRAGNIETARSLTVKLDKTAPTVQLTANPSTIKGNNGKPVAVTLSGNGADAISGLASVSYVVTDEYGDPLGIAARTLSGLSATWTETLNLEARRNGNDLNGRLYRVTATITDLAGHTATSTTEILVPHDQGNN